MLVLDLFCCAGGASEGYVRAGHTVVGIDIDPQPNYPYTFYRLDALELLGTLIAGGTIDSLISEYEVGPYSWAELDGFDFIHASPPCQLFSVYNNNKTTAKSTKDKYLNLIPQTRELLVRSGKPYVIENVPRSPLVNPIQLCGTSFGIPVRRHRLFELGQWSVEAPKCRHQDFTERRFPGSSNRPNGRTVCNVGEYRVPLATQKECMTIDRKVTLHELSEMVPPPYTQWIGEQYEAYKRASGKV